ncbi:MAG: PepSY domain-containing protein, partial [Gemmata sp.]
VSLLFDVNAPGGTVRARTAPPPPKVEEPVPFAIGARGTPKGSGREKAAPPGNGTGLQLDAPLHERVKAAVPVVLARTGFPDGDTTITSVPDLSFRMTDGEKTWVVTYNALTGTVSGTSAESVLPPDELSTRRFLTRMHLAHGYPGDTGAKWFWAVIVDAMAFVMVFWGVSGLFMWWQLKGARLPGFAVLLCSAAAATALGFGMHELLLAK